VAEAVAGCQRLVDALVDRTAWLLDVRSNTSCTNHHRNRPVSASTTLPSSRRPQIAASRGHQPAAGVFLSAKEPAAATTVSQAAICSSSSPCPEGGGTQHRRRGGVSAAAAAALQKLNTQFVAENAALCIELARWESGLKSRAQPGVATSGVGAHRAASAPVVTTVDTATAAVPSCSSAGQAVDDPAPQPIAVEQTPQPRGSSPNRPSSGCKPAAGSANSTKHSRAHSCDDLVSAALQAAVREVLCAGTEVLPAALQSNHVPPCCPFKSHNSLMRQQAAGRGVEAALAAADTNISLRARAVALEAAMLDVAAERAADATALQRERQRNKLLQQQLQELSDELVSARGEADQLRQQVVNLQQGAQQREHEGAATSGMQTRPGSPAALLGGGGGCLSRPYIREAPLPTMHAFTGPAAPSSCCGESVRLLDADGCSTAGAMSVRGLAAALMSKAQNAEEARRLAAVVSAAKHDLAERELRIAALETRFRELTAKLVQERDRCGRRDAQLLLLRQRLAAAHMALLDAGAAIPAAALPSQLSIKMSGGWVDGDVAGPDAEESVHRPPTSSLAAVVEEEGPAPGSSSSSSPAAAGRPVTAESNPQTNQSNQQRRERHRRRRTTDAIVAEGVTAGPLSFTAAMEGREKERECRRLEAACDRYRERVSLCWGRLSEVDDWRLDCWTVKSISTLQTHRTPTSRDNNRSRLWSKSAPSCRGASPARAPPTCASPTRCAPSRGRGVRGWRRSWRGRRPRCGTPRRGWRRARRRARRCSSGSTRRWRRGMRRGPMPTTCGGGSLRPGRVEADDAPSPVPPPPPKGGWVGSCSSHACVLSRPRPLPTNQLQSW